MDFKDHFFNSEDFDNLKITINIEELTIKLVALFEKEKFKFYPEWRGIHKSGTHRKNFTFKVKQPSGKLENIITIYPMAGWLKVEVYRGQYEKTHYSVYLNTIDEYEQIKPLLKDATDIYNSISTLKL